MKISPITDHLRAPFTHQGRPLSREAKVLSVITGLAAFAVFRLQRLPKSSFVAGPTAFYVMTALFKVDQSQRPNPFFKMISPPKKVSSKSEALGILGLPEDCADMPEIKDKYELLLKDLQRRKDGVSALRSEVVAKSFQNMIETLNNAYNFLVKNGVGSDKKKQPSITDLD